MLAIAALALLVPQTAVAAQDLPQGWAGLSACKGCHEEVVTRYLAGPHGGAMIARGTPLEKLCESCHGPGAAHGEDPMATRPGRLGGAESLSVCRACHEAVAFGLESSMPAHIREGVGCLACHDSGHASPPRETLLRQEPVPLCGSCHQQQVSLFSLPFSHRQGLSPMPCTECHRSHETKPSPGLKASESQNSCISCPSEKQGPYVFPHPPQEVRSCMACHQPHGSPNPQALIRADVSFLCLECHADTPRSHDLSQPRYRQCTACHQAVHGSQRSSRLFQE